PAVEGLIEKAVGIRRLDEAVADFVNLPHWNEGAKSGGSVSSHLGWIRVESTGHGSNPVYFPQFSEGSAPLVKGEFLPASGFQTGAHHRGFGRPDEMVPDGGHFLFLQGEKAGIYLRRGGVAPLLLPCLEDLGEGHPLL